MNQGSHSKEEESQSTPHEQECFQSRKYCSMGREFLCGGLQEEPFSHPRSGEGESKGWGEWRVGETADHKRGKEDSSLWNGLCWLLRLVYNKKTTEAAVLFWTVSLELLPFTVFIMTLITLIGTTANSDLNNSFKKILNLKVTCRLNLSLILLLTQRNVLIII